MGELRSKALKGIIWSAVDKIGVRAITFIVSILIARILSPSDYGVIGMILVFITIANIFINSGMSQAIVQKQDRSEIDLSTAFFFNILVSIVCYIILFFAAPFISKFYNEPILTNILRILGLNIIVSAFATVQRANLLVKLDFKTIALVYLVAAISSGFVGIWMAYVGFGVWALVGQQMTTIITSTIVFWILGKWRPRTGFSKSSFISLWKFGSKLLASGLSSTILNEINSIAIGKFYKAADLGYYTRAVQTSDVVAKTSNEVINAVTFPVLSTIQNDRKHLVSVYRKMLGMTAFIIFPTMTLLAVIAKPFIVIVLTEKWLLTVPLLQWMCFARIMTPISSINMSVLNAIGRSDLFMKVDFSKIPLIIITMLITIPIGVEAIVIGDFFVTVISYFINAYMPGKLFSFGLIAQFKIYYKIIFATFLMGVITYFSIFLIPNINIQLIIGIIVSIISYLSACYFLKVEQLIEVRIEINKFFRKYL